MTITSEAKDSLLGHRQEPPHYENMDNNFIILLQKHAQHHSAW